MEDKFGGNSTNLRVNPMEVDLQQIISHILQDCAEKVDEVQVKAEEEFKNERVREILQGFNKIDSDYKMKETRTMRDTLVYESKMKNLSRLKILQTKFEHVDDVFEKARMRLSNKDMSTHSTPYQEILKALIMQGLCKLLEANVIITVRKSDLVLVRSIIGEVKDSYEKMTGLPVELHLSERKFLNLASEGGVLLSSPDYSVTLDNTLASRLDMISYYLLPETSLLLFGQTKQEVVTRTPSYLPSIRQLEELLDTPRPPSTNEISLKGFSILTRPVDETLVERLNPNLPYSQ